MNSILQNRDLDPEILTKQRKLAKDWLGSKKDDRGNVIEKITVSTENKARELVNSFKIDLTGARPGDTLIGAMKGTRGAVIKLHGNRMVLPTRKKLNIIRQHPNLWESFLTKLQSIDYFSGMSEQSIEEWFRIHQDDYDKSLGDHHVQIEIIHLGAMADKMEQECISKLLQPGKLWLAEEIEACVPRKPGSKARRHTLILTRDFWTISYITPNIDFEGPFFDLITTKWVDKISDSKELLVLQDLHASTTKRTSIGILVPKNRFHGPFEEYEQFGITKENLDFFRNSMINLTPAAYKSLLQKIIRFQPYEIKFPNGTHMSSRKVLAMTIGELISIPGSFVPDIQRYVTGLESATKRLAVTSVEDSFLSPEYILQLLMSALLAQRIKDWRPSKQMIINWINMSIEAMESEKYYVYNGNKGMKQPVFYIKPNNTIVQNNSAVLDSLKSFSYDLGLFRNIGHCLKIKVEESISSERPSSMNFEHFVDHHWAPNIALFYKPEDMEKYCEKSSPGKPFELFFQKLWQEVSSLNPRKQIVQYTDFFYKTRSAQLQVLKNKQINTQIEQILSQIPKEILLNCVDKLQPKDSFTFEYTLDDGWLAALVGALEPRNVQIPVYVTINPDNIYEYVAIRRPSREMDKKPLDYQLEKEAIEGAKKLLERGILLNKATAPSKKLENAKVYLKNNQYVIRTSQGEEIQWDTFKHLQLYIPQFWSNHRRQFMELVDQTSIRVLSRVLMYLSSYRNQFELNRISRDGGSIKQAVNVDDVATFSFLKKFIKIYPNVLKETSSKIGYFESEFPPMLWEIRDYIANHIVSKSTFTNKWVTFNDSKNRKLWKHQKDALISMKNNFKSGRRGNFLWLKVGMGKTLIVLKFLEYLQSIEKLPPYIIYTLPNSAMKTVIDEIKTFGIPINLQIPIKNTTNKSFPKGIIVTTGNCKPKPYTITMISSDNHLRMCESELLKIAPKSIFIIDEVHKALNETQRTSTAIQLSSLATQFIAFTGTPVVDTKTYKLIWWLEKIVPFEVNERNFWVAANAMIAKIANTNIPIVREEILGKFNENELNKYLKIVPPVLGGKNTNPDLKDFQNATEICYNICNREIVKQTIDHINNGVVVVAKNKEHQEKLYKMLVEFIDSKKVLLMNEPINLTSEDKSDVQVIVVPINKAEGYNLTKMSIMISGVYPSNQATRTQIEGRIDRIGQTAEKLIYITVHTGILTRIMREHQNARSLSKALESMHQEFGKNEI